jgi:hypothetical protein
MKIIINFYWFLYRLFKHRKDEDLFVNDYIYNNRLNECLNCEHIKNDGILCYIKGSRCGLCGCFVEYKTKFMFEECPDIINKKW